jgi:ABC-type antimicrobial peptide transport system permease subunit
LDCLTKDKLLKKGSSIAKVYGDSKYVLAICGKNDFLKTGDVLEVDGQALTIAGTLKYNLFSSDGSLDEKTTLITSDETFTRLTGISDYSLVMIQTTKDVTDENVAVIRNAVGDNGTFSDMRDQRTVNTYVAFVSFVYAFLIIIAMVTVLNIINSISMSVSAKTKQYGAMRAVGMDERQITKMIAAEAFTYAVSGCAVGCIIGLLISKQLYDYFIAARFSYATWNIPVVPLVIILLFVVAAAIAAVYAPANEFGICSY